MSKFPPTNGEVSHICYRNVVYLFKVPGTISYDFLTISMTLKVKITVGANQVQKSVIPLLVQEIQ